jgi:hypothetical protein
VAETAKIPPAAAPSACRVGGKTLALRHTMRALYRIQSAGLPDDLAGLFDDGKRVATLCNWLWACDGSGAFATPDALADAMTMEQVAPAMDALLAAWRASQPPAPDAPDAEKKTA